MTTTSNTFAPICMTEEFWANSPFSIARHYGQIKIGDHTYVIVNKEGKDIFECSAEADKAGREKAIEPGEPADLVRKDFIPFYRKLGREMFFAVLKRHPRVTDNDMKQYMKEAYAQFKPIRQRTKVKNIALGLSDNDNK